MKNITIDGVEYAPVEKVASEKNLPYVIIRTYSAGVHAGYLQRRDGREVELRDSRRIWQWSGAATLSQLAMEGTSDPDGCRFPAPVNSIVLTEAIEIIPCTEQARESIEAVEVWSA